MSSFLAAAADVNASCIALGNNTVITPFSVGARVGYEGGITYGLIIGCAVLAILFAVWHAQHVLKIPIATFGMDGGESPVALGSALGRRRARTPHTSARSPAPRLRRKISTTRAARLRSERTRH